MNKPRKRFGQHFLHDEAVIQHILDVFNPKKSEIILEIGPGQGALTFPLLKRIGKLTAIELDRDLVPLLEERAKNIGELTVHNVDVLNFDFASARVGDQQLRIIGNLPYNISTPLTFHLLENAHHIQDMVFMLQKEVAHRMAASPGTKNYGRLSIMTQYFCQPDLLFDVPPEAFDPPPKVMSSIIRLTPHQTKPFVAQDEKLFADIVKTAFGQRRKTLRNSLKNSINDSAWAHINIESNLRPEVLSVKEFVDISNAMSEQS